jgi:hypothetical protein
MDAIVDDGMSDVSQWLKSEARPANRRVIDQVFADLDDEPLGDVLANDMFE